MRLLSHLRQSQAVTPSSPADVMPHSLPNGEHSLEGPVGRRTLARRERVKDVAASLFACAGFHATGVAQIAAQSGIAVAQIYRDFASKEEIVIEIVIANYRRFIAAHDLKYHIDSKNIAEVRSWLLGVVNPNLISTERALLTEIVAESARNERIARVFEQMRHETKRNIVMALNVIAPEQTKDRKERIAEAILIISLGSIYRGLSTCSEKSLSLIIKSMLDHQIDCRI